MAASQVSTSSQLPYLDTAATRPSLDGRQPAKRDEQSGVEAQRQPSQEDLEIARQLQQFQSQNNAQTPSMREDANARLTPQNDEEALAQQLRQTGSPTRSEHSNQRLTSPGPALTGQVCTNCGTSKTPLWRRSPAGAAICNACGLYYKARNQMRPVGLKRAANVASPATSSPAQSQPQDRGTSPVPLQSGANYVSTDQIADGTCPGGGRCNSQGGKVGCQGCPSFNNRIAKAAQVALRQANDAASGGGRMSDVQPSNASQQNVVVACQNCGTTITPLWRRDEAGNAICNACGLYHKLHGHHRPVQMKKAEIKRRKRVVPVHGAFDASQPNFNDQPQPSPSTLQSQPMSIMEPRTGPSPIPVDFTEAFRSSAPTGESQTVPSKRTYSSTESEPYPHAQNMGFSAINAIDPSLPSREDQPTNREARRAELHREAEKMRQMLEEKEREIAALNDDG